MRERGLEAWADTPSNDADFHRWLAERNRHRAARLGWSLIAVLIASIAALVFLALQMNELGTRFDASRDQVRNLNRRVESVLADSRADARRAEKRMDCLEAYIADTSEGFRRLLKFETTAPAYLRRYPARPSCG